jgi:NAD(P)-dependent dehydrogenase (short-subunit alcohol dehydrogenase family)
VLVAAGEPYLIGYSAMAAGLKGFLSNCFVGGETSSVRSGSRCVRATIDLRFGDREEFVRHDVAHCPTPRMAAPEEVARAALFLVSDDSSFVNGVGLAVDGAKAAGVFNADRYRMDFQSME